MEGKITENSGQTFSEIRKKYEEKRQDSEEVLRKAGINTRSKEGKKARYLTAKRFFRIEQEGDTDILTGLPNRSGFIKRYNDLVKTSNRDGDEMVIAIADLNRLKEVNDTKGHKAGDKYIRTAAQTLRTAVRETDLVARYGGDEFVILFRKARIEDVEGLWQKRIQPLLNEYGISLSAGAALVDPDDPNYSLDNADKKMYSSKNRYRRDITQENILVTHSD